jgi:hypothetical protein
MMGEIVLDDGGEGGVGQMEDGSKEMKEVETLQQHHTIVREFVWKFQSGYLKRSAYDISSIVRGEENTGKNLMH